MIEITFPDKTAALVEDIDSDLAELNWWKTQGYASGRINKKFVYLHRIILERMVGRKLCRGEYTDHINRNPLDNRRCNLRIANGSESTRNRGKRSGTSSNFIGVSYFNAASKRNKRWKAYIRLNGRQITIGYFLTQEEAARARDKAVSEHYGEFGSLNYVGD